MITGVLIGLLLLASEPRGADAKSPDSEIDMSLGCQTNPAVIPPCETFRGRLRVYNGTPSLRIAPTGTKRLKGLIPSEDERTLPTRLREHVQFGVELWADFLFCPFTRDKPGQMQMGCVESAANVVVHRHRENAPAEVFKLP